MRLKKFFLFLFIQQEKTKANKTRLIFLFEIGRQVRYNNRHEVQRYEIDTAIIPKKVIKNVFHGCAEKVKRKHVHQQVNVAAVNKARGDEAIILLLVFY